MESTMYGMKIIWSVNIKNLAVIRVIIMRSAAIVHTVTFLLRICKGVHIVKFNYNIKLSIDSLCVDLNVQVLAEQ